MATFWSHQLQGAWIRIARGKIFTNAGTTSSLLVLKPSFKIAIIAAVLLWLSFLWFYRIGDKPLAVKEA